MPGTGTHSWSHRLLAVTLVATSCRKVSAQDWQCANAALVVQRDGSLQLESASAAATNGVESVAACKQLCEADPECTLLGYAKRRCTLVHGATYIALADVGGVRPNPRAQMCEIRGAAGAEGCTLRSDYDTASPSIGAAAFDDCTGQGEWSFLATSDWIDPTSTLSLAGTLAIQFRGINSPTDISSSAAGLVWNAAVPHGFSLSAVIPDDPPTNYGTGAPTEPSTQLPAAVLQGGLLYRQDSTTDVLYSNQKIALGASHTFFALVTPIGSALAFGAVAAFRPNDAPGVFAYVMGTNFGDNRIFTDDWRPSGFQGPTFVPGEPQLVVWRCSIDPASGTPQAEMTVLEQGQATAQVQWSSTLYASGLEEYSRDMLDESFDIDMRDPDVDGLHSLAAGYLIVGNWANRGDMQFRGVIHHLEWHIGTLDDASVEAVAASIWYTAQSGAAPTENDGRQCFHKLAPPAAPRRTDVSVGSGRRTLQGFNFHRHENENCPAASFDDRVTEVDAVCCATDRNGVSECNNGVPTTCELRCALVFDKFFTECHDFLVQFADAEMASYTQLEQECLSQELRPMIYAAARADCAQESCAAGVGEQPTGVTQIRPPGGAAGGESVSAYCEMETEGGGWTLVWTYPIQGAIDDFSSFWTSTRTAVASPPTEPGQAAMGSFFDTMVPNPAEGFDLLLTCSSGGTLRYLYYENVDASRLVSPSTELTSCAEQGGGIQCDFSYESFGLPTVVSGFGADGPQNFPNVINRENPNTGYRYRWGVGESTWNVKWGVDRNDQEYDCGQPNAAVTGADYWAVFVRPTGGGGGGGGGGGDAGGGGGGGH